MSILSYLANTDLPQAQGGGGESQGGGEIPPHILNGAPPSMGVDYLLLNNRVQEAKDASGQVETLLVQEREERRIAITDIWSKLREVQKEVRDAKLLMHKKPEPEVHGVHTTANHIPSPQQQEAIMQSSLDISRLEKEMSRWKAQMQQSVQDLWSQVRSPVANQHSAGGDTSLKQMKSDMVNLQKMVMELQLNVSMAAIRASRIAMRTNELSERGKKEAIAVLEAKEQAITKQMEASRKERGVTTTYDADVMQGLHNFPTRQGISPDTEDGTLQLTASTPQVGGGSTAIGGMGTGLFPATQSEA